MPNPGPSTQRVMKLRIHGASVHRSVQLKDTYLCDSEKLSVDSGSSACVGDANSAMILHGDEPENHNDTRKLGYTLTSLGQSKLVLASNHSVHILELRAFSYWDKYRSALKAARLSQNLILSTRVGSRVDVTTASSASESRKFV